MTTTPDQRRPFLDAIRLDPEADAPRLIYADWLDESGESERAAFVRFGVASELPGRWGHGGDRPSRAELLVGEGLPPPPGGWVLFARRCLSPFRRGFIDGHHPRTPEEVAAVRLLRSREPLGHFHGQGLPDGSPWWIDEAGLDLAAGAGRLTLRIDRAATTWPAETLRCRFLSLSASPLPAAPNAPSLVGLALDTDGDPGPFLTGLGRPLDEVRLDRLDSWGVRRRTNRQARDPALVPTLLRHPALEPASVLTLGECGGASPQVLFAALGSRPVRSLRMACRGDAAAFAQGLRRWTGAAGLRDLWLSGGWELGPHLVGRPADPVVLDLGRTCRELRTLTLRGEISSASLPKSLERLDAPPGQVDLTRDAPDLRALRHPIGWRHGLPGAFTLFLPHHLERLAGGLCDPLTVQRLAELPRLAGLTALELRGHPGSWSPAVVAALAGGIFGRTVRAVTLGPGWADRALMRAAAEAFGPRCDAYWYQG